MAVQFAVKMPHNGGLGYSDIKARNFATGYADTMGLEEITNHIKTWSVAASFATQRAPFGMNLSGPAAVEWGAKTRKNMNLQELLKWIKRYEVAAEYATDLLDVCGMELEQSPAVAWAIEKANDRSISDLDGWIGQQRADSLQKYNQLQCRGVFSKFIRRR